jgi:hypothetical protein
MDVLVAAPGETIVIPFKAGVDMTVGAISLTLGYPFDRIEITGVFLGDNPLHLIPFNVLNEKLKIGWYSNNPSVLTKNQTLFSIKVRIKEGNIPGDQIRLTLSSDPLNELGDRFFQVISGAEVNAATLKIISTEAITLIDESRFSMLPYPNPAKESFRLQYEIPENGRVLIEAYDFSGRKVATLVDESKVAGIYDGEFRAEVWTPGVYLLKLNLRNGTTYITLSKKLIIN